MRRMSPTATTQPRKATQLHRFSRWASCVLPAEGLLVDSLYGTTNPEQAIKAGGPGG